MLRREFKVVVLNGQAKYVTGQKEGKSVRHHAFALRLQIIDPPPLPPNFNMQGKSFRESFQSYQDLFEFAELAVRLLHAAKPFCMADFVLRVDIMQANDGRFVVNEFESFEAYVCCSSRDGRDQIACYDFMTNYWLRVINRQFCFD